MQLHIPMNQAHTRGMPVRTSPGQTLRDVLADLGRQGPLGLFRLWRERWCYRRDLARLVIVGPYMINDIGLTLDQALAQVDRPFWCQ
jgi:uncharacterized protein YjiS (DUF1127 family)